VAEAAKVVDGTGAGLLAFLEWAGSRGEIPLSTAKNIAVAAGKVLAVEPDPAAMDVLRLDPEDVFGRFQTLNRTSYTTESLNAYRSRFFKGIYMYRAWLDNRSDWKSVSSRPPSKAVAVKSTGTGKTTPKARSRRAAASSADSSPDAAEPVSAVPAIAMVPYDLPLRPGLRVRLVLPEILTRADAKRITAFVTSLAFDQEETTEEGA